MIKFFYFELKKQFPVINNSDNIEIFNRQKVFIEGRYEVEPIAESNKVQPVNIVFEDGGRISRSKYPLKNEFCFYNKKVFLLGKVLISENNQKTNEISVNPEYINIVPGEKLLLKKVNTLPNPPKVETAKELESFENYWVQIFGNMSDFKKYRNDEFWGNSQIRLKDGSKIMLENVFVSKWNELKFSEVTVIGILKKSEEGFYQVSGKYSICRGMVNGCKVYFSNGIKSVTER